MEDNGEQGSDDPVMRSTHCGAWHQTTVRGASVFVTPVLCSVPECSVSIAGHLTSIEAQARLNLNPLGSSEYRYKQSFYGQNPIAPVPSVELNAGRVTSTRHSTPVANEDDARLVEALVQLPPEHESDQENALLAAVTFRPISEIISLLLASKDIDGPRSRGGTYF